MMIMTSKTFNQGGAAVYETPTLTALDIKSEGLLCVSTPGAAIESATEDDWGTL